MSLKLKSIDNLVPYLAVQRSTARMFTTASNLLASCILGYLRTSDTGWTTKVIVYGRRSCVGTKLVICALVST